MSQPKLYRLPNSNIRYSRWSWYNFKRYPCFLVDSYKHTLKDNWPTLECSWCIVKDKRIRIFAEYAWDGASGPTIDTQDTARGSLVHDALYQLIRTYKLHEMRDEADKEFRHILLTDGVPKWRAELWYNAVKHFGGKHAK